MLTFIWLSVRTSNWLKIGIISTLLFSRRDLTRKMVEATAFRRFEGWWDEQKAGQPWNGQQGKQEPVSLFHYYLIKYL